MQKLSLVIQVTDSWPMITAYSVASVGILLMSCESRCCVVVAAATDDDDDDDLMFHYYAKFSMSMLKCFIA